MNMKYYFSEDFRESFPKIMGKFYTENDLEDFYIQAVDHREYKDFQEWFFDMLKMGLVVCIKEENKMKDIIKDLIQLAEENEDYELIYQIRRLIQELALTYNAPSNWRNIASELQKEYTSDSWVYEELELGDYKEELEAIQETFNE